MNLIDFIGFIIVMFAMIFLLAKRAWEEKRRRDHPEEFEAKEEEKETALREFLESLNIETDEFESVPSEEIEQESLKPPPAPEEQEKTYVPERLVRDAYHLESAIEDAILASELESRILETDIAYAPFTEDGYQTVSEDLFLELTPGAYEIIDDNTTSRIKKMVSQMKDRRDLLIYHEVMSQPKALQQSYLPSDLSEK